ncbi:MAG: DUF4199 domain-containing protein [Cytophagales bacterium]|nr:DUF4199 domain-containing protein [Cytophagales bacterium]
MKKVILIFGSVIGLVLATNSIFHMDMMYSNPDYVGNDVIGYATMVIVFSVIYFGVRNYRNKLLDGQISFLKALKTGALICFVASTYYVVLGLLYYHFVVPDFMDVYADYMIKNAPASEVEATTAQMASFKEMTKNPFFLVLFSYFEVLPIGMIVALISALIVKKK